VGGLVPVPARRIASALRKALQPMPAADLDTVLGGTARVYRLTY
jgi:hypothetical protein